MSTAVETKTQTGDFKVADLKLADWGRKEIGRASCRERVYDDV